MQQCVEKALKGYLSFKEQPIKKIHDLVILTKECATFDESFSSLLHIATRLKPYITESRYPDDFVEEDEDKDFMNLSLKTHSIFLSLLKKN